MEFDFQSNSVMNSLKCAESHCLTELFPIYQNKHQTIRRWNDPSVDPSSYCIILKVFQLYIIIATCRYFHLFLHNICLLQLELSFIIKLSCLLFSWSLTHILYFPWFYATNFAVSFPCFGPEDFRDQKCIRSLKQTIGRLYMTLFPSIFAHILGTKFVKSQPSPANCSLYESLH